MNKLSTPARTQIVNLLVEGMSIRSISRVTGASKNTIVKLLVSVGRAAEKFHNETVKNLKSTKVQADEIWSFVYAKPKNLPEEMEGLGGEVWTWTAMDADSKLIISWLVGDRSAHSAKDFIADMKSRITTERIQLSTDGYPKYREAVEKSFHGVIDFAQIVKIYGTDPNAVSKYGTSDCIGTEKTVVFGNPDTKHIATSFVERQNLTMRMGMRRFTRLTNAFSKKMENHWLAIALHFYYYNFVRVHQTLKVTPAMEAGLTKRPMTIEDIINLA